MSGAFLFCVERKMLAFFVRRLIMLLFTLYAVVTFAFFVMRLAPGDPARIIAGFDAPYETILALRHELGLDRPLIVQYGRYLAALFRGDFGRSYNTRRPVLEELGWRYKNTIILALCAVSFATFLGMTLGGLTALRPYSVFDSFAMVLALLGVSAPIFWLGVIFMWVFGVKLRLLPTGGTGTIRHIILPSITLGLALSAVIARMTRSCLLECLGQDYVRTARAMGFAERTVIYRYALRNALIPVVTVVGLQLGYSLAGAVLTETVFAWPGLGRLLVDSIFARDYPVVQGCFIFVAFTFALTNFLVDLLYSVLDPRIRYR
jgi:peptide/nickel transport system permease protein/oligopeptide transport system permease protein